MGSGASAVTHPILPTPCLQVTFLGCCLRMDTEVVAPFPWILVLCPPNRGCYMCLAFSRPLKWDQVFSLFLRALASGGTFQPCSGHQCQLPIPLETCSLPGTLLCCSTGQWLGAAKHLDLPLGLAAKMDAVFYFRLVFFLLKDDLGLTRNPQKCGRIATAALGEPTCLSLS